MTTIKSYTDLSQSKALTEILPIESEDMRYGYVAYYGYSGMYDGGYDEVPYPKDFLTKNNHFSTNEYDVELPCWSLAALIDVLPNENMLVKTTDGEYYCLAKDVMTKHYDNPVDACYEMILKLYKL